MATEKRDPGNMEVMGAIYRGHENSKYFKFLSDINQFPLINILLKNKGDKTQFIPDTKTVDEMIDMDIGDTINILYALYMPRKITSLDDFRKSEDLGARYVVELDTPASKNKLMINDSPAYIYSIGHDKDSVFGVSGIIDTEKLKTRDERQVKKAGALTGLMDVADRIGHPNTRYKLKRKVLKALDKFNYSAAFAYAGQMYYVLCVPNYLMPQDMLYYTPITSLLLVIANGIPRRNLEKDKYQMMEPSNAIVQKPWKVVMNSEKTIKNTDTSMKQRYDDLKVIKASVPKKLQYSFNDLIPYVEKAYNDDPITARIKLVLDYISFTETTMIARHLSSDDSRQDKEIAEVVFKMGDNLLSSTNGVGEVWKNTAIEKVQFKPEFVESPNFLYTYMDLSDGHKLAEDYIGHVKLIVAFYERSQRMKKSAFTYSPDIVRSVQILIALHASSIPTTFTHSENTAKKKRMVMKSDNASFIDMRAKVFPTIN